MMTAFLVWYAFGFIGGLILTAFEFHERLQRRDVNVTSGDILSILFLALWGPLMFLAAMSEIFNKDWFGQFIEYISSFTFFTLKKTK